MLVSVAISDVSRDLVSIQLTLTSISVYESSSDPPLRPLDLHSISQDGLQPAAWSYTAIADC